MDNENEQPSTVDALPSRCLGKLVSNLSASSSRPPSASPAPLSASSTTSSTSSSVIANQSSRSVGSNATAANDVNSSIVSMVQTDVRPKQTRARKVDRKWVCGACHGDVRLPPPIPPTTTTATATIANTPLQEDESSAVEKSLHLTTSMCALKCCPAPRYHLRCSGVPIGSQIFRNSIISYQVSANQSVSTDDNAAKKIYDAQHILEHLYSSSAAVWWDVLPDINILNSKYHRSQQSLQNVKNWPTSMQSFMCPNCDVEGTSRYLSEYFERFHSMKTTFYEDHLSKSNITGVGKRLDRADESMEARTGKAFLWHLMKDNRKDYLRMKQAAGDATCCVIDWNPSEIRLKNMARVLTYLSKELQQQQMQQQQRRQKRQKNKFHLDPSYLVGMPIRLFNPIDKSYHSGRVIDYKMNAPYQIDESVSNAKPSASSEAGAAPDIDQLTDGKILSTLYLIRFRHGVDGRKIAVHQWIYLEEHAVTIGGEVCWAKVGEQSVDAKASGPNEKNSNVGKTTIPGSGTNVLKSDIKLQAQEQEYASNYRPVQIVFRSMLEMIPLQNLKSTISGVQSMISYASAKGKESKNGSCCLKILAMGFGQSFSHVRLTLGDSGMNTVKTRSEAAKVHVSQTSTAELKRPNVIPFTSNNPSWIDRILHRAQLSDEDVALGSAMACMEKEEERRIRSWCRLSVDHLAQPSFIRKKCPVTSATTPSTAPSIEPEKCQMKCITPSNSSQLSSKRPDLRHDVSPQVAASLVCIKCMDEFNTGEKTNKPHDADCPRKRREHTVSLEVAASFGCKKCMKEFKTGKKSRQSHNENCPRKRNFFKGNRLKEESIQPSHSADNSHPHCSEQLEHKSSVQEDESTEKQKIASSDRPQKSPPPTKKQKTKQKIVSSDRQQESPPPAKKQKISQSTPFTANTMKRLKQYVHPPDPRPCYGCQWCGPKVKDSQNTICTTCQLLQTDGWSCKIHESARKKCFSSANGEKFWSIKDFLSTTTEIVARKMKSDAQN